MPGIQHLAGAVRNDCLRYTPGWPVFPLDRSLTHAVSAAGCQEVFIDKASGKLTRRPELDKALLSANRTRDQLVITKLDWLGRSLEHLIELSAGCRPRRSTWWSSTRSSTPPPLSGKMFFQILGSIAEFEHVRAPDGRSGRRPCAGPRRRGR